jgi:hypothetical protein
MKSALIILILCFGAAVFGQKSTDPAYKIRADKRGGVVIRFKAKTHRLDVSRHTDAASVAASELLFAAEKAGFRYLVIDLSGGSRKKRNDRQCGAGVESNMIWLKLDAAWKIVGVRSARYQSCWSGTELNDAVKITKSTLEANFDNIRDRMNVRLFYSADEPEKGFQIVETPLAEVR